MLLQIQLSDPYTVTVSPEDRLVIVAFLEHTTAEHELSDWQPRLMPVVVLKKPNEKTQSWLRPLQDVVGQAGTSTPYMASASVCHHCVIDITCGQGSAQPDGCVYEIVDKPPQSLHDA
jgi:hypothetical protein